jgi:PleD family two-component response regulator
VSIGVASRGGQESRPWTAQDLLSEADALMYDAKRGGKNRSAFASQRREEGSHDKAPGRRSAVP